MFHHSSRILLAGIAACVKYQGESSMVQQNAYEFFKVRGLPLSTSTPREGGDVGPKEDIVLELSKGGWVTLQTRGRRGPKNLKILRMPYDM